MVPYLVDDLGLDVNDMDTKEKLRKHWGAPSCHAARVPGDSEEVIHFLLSHGADSSIKDCWGTMTLL